MKKIPLFLAIVVTIVTAATILNSNNSLCEFWASNVEVLANWEEPNTGTCCPEDGSYCCVGPHAIPNYFYQKEGPCNKQ